MSHPALYDDDILLWSEEQADIIRQLGRTRRDLPNELDVDNVAEEIESVGRSELASVETYLELILSHLIKISSEPLSDSVRHWRAEIIAFHGNMKRRYTPSMLQRIDLPEAWRIAREQAIAASGAPDDVAAALPVQCPLVLNELLADRLDSGALATRLVPPPQH